MLAVHFSKCSPIFLGRSFGKNIAGHFTMVSLLPYKSGPLYFCYDKLRQRNEALKLSGVSYGPSIAAQAIIGSYFQGCISSVTSRGHLTPLMGTLSASSAVLKHLGIASRSNYVASGLYAAARLNEKASKIGWGLRCASWVRGGVSAGLIFGICLCLANLKVAHAEAVRMKNSMGVQRDVTISSSHGKTVYTDYSVTGIPGDGRCLFRSVAHGACLVSGKLPPNENLQQELADELRARVADEFIKRRDETEWFIEGDFDSYVSQIRNPHVWGGEPELLMASHVLEIRQRVWQGTNSGSLSWLWPL
ncbi:OVARIAN TUMOR DOMAIN-containing deubiquitinating enzyme 4-like isoform X2 [Nymphaea colorata]|uniref:OVARIAN TUMOR DOMAIN-containing deubiquitinating enzyme 4-like isoform X2 n=1 Tax=Nymphaea colorata TaxID=210225 RepID=UPI00129ED445|nr:OVARIAN TUMOR DOMAIN-containing deubiquitinating enzyme 4-like isoform X2 [Nymphaea colorata]